MKEHVLLLMGMHRVKKKVTNHIFLFAGRHLAITGLEHSLTMITVAGSNPVVATKWYLWWTESGFSRDSPISRFSNFTNISTQTSGGNIKLSASVPVENNDYSGFVNSPQSLPTYHPLSPRERKMAEFRETYSPSFLQGMSLHQGGFAMVRIFAVFYQIVILSLSNFEFKITQNIILHYGYTR